MNGRSFRMSRRIQLAWRPVGLIGVLAILGAACSSTEAPDEATEISVAVGDLTTAVGSEPMMPVRLLEESLFGPTAQDISGSLALLRLDEQLEIPLVVSTREEVIEVSPAEPLRDGWHSLVIRVAGLDINPNTAAKLENGFPTIRFRPDSAPTLSGVSLCEKESGEIRAVVGFSEAMDWSRSERHVAVMNGASSCTLVEAAGRKMTLSCAAGSAEAWRVVVSEGASGATGKPFETLGGSPSLDVTFSRELDAFESEAFCRTWKPN